MKATTSLPAGGAVPGPMQCRLGVLAGLEHEPIGERSGSFRARYLSTKTQKSAFRVDEECKACFIFARKAKFKPIGKMRLAKYKPNWACSEG